MANVHNKRLNSDVTLLVCSRFGGGSSHFWRVSTCHVDLLLCLSYGMTSHGETAQENCPFTLCREKRGIFHSHDWKSELINMVSTAISIYGIISEIVHKSKWYQLFLLPVLWTALHIVIKVSSLHHSWWLWSKFLIRWHFDCQKQLFEHEFMVFCTTISFYTCRTHKIYKHTHIMYIHNYFDSLSHAHEHSLTGTIRGFCAEEQKRTLLGNYCWKACGISVLT